MSATVAPTTLEGYKAASREVLEAVINRFAKIEMAIDLEPGSMVEGLLEYLSSGSVEDVTSHINATYDLKDVPENWKEIVERVIDDEL